MEQRRLGRSGLVVSALGVGTFGFAGAADRSARAVLDRAADGGVTLVDTADTYGGGRAETIVGDWLRGRRRDTIVLSTKGGNPTGPGPDDRGATRTHLTAALEASLRRLRTDYVDLYQVHAFDPNVSLEETALTLDDLVKSGKVRHIGASRYTGPELARALATSDLLQAARFASIQVSHSLIDRSEEREIFALCAAQGLGIITYWPLAGGMLTGKYADPAALPPGSRAFTQDDYSDRITAERRSAAAAVAVIAAELGCLPGQLALGWALAQPVACILSGASGPQQVDENLAALDLVIPDAAMAALDELSRGFTKVGLRVTTNSS